MPPEIWELGGPTLHVCLNELLDCCWKQGKFPQFFRDADNISMYKSKGERFDCSNYPALALHSIAGKILARVLSNRLVPSIAEEDLPVIQCGFIANSGMKDMLFVRRQLYQQCQEQDKGLHATFIVIAKSC